MCVIRHTEETISGLPNGAETQQTGAEIIFRRFQHLAGARRHARASIFHQRPDLSRHRQRCHCERWTGDYGIDLTGHRHVAPSPQGGEGAQFHAANHDQKTMSVTSEW